MNLGTSGIRIIPNKLGVCATACLFFFLVQAPESQHPVENQYFIERIEIVGYRRVQNSTIRAHILSRPGGPYNAEAVQCDAQARSDTGYFNEVRLTVEDTPRQPNGKIVVFAGYWQSSLPDTSGQRSLAGFFAEAGKTYFFRVQTHGEFDSAEPETWSIDLQPIDADEGKYLVASYPLSISHLKKQN